VAAARKQPEGEQEEMATQAVGEDSEYQKQLMLLGQEHHQFQVETCQYINTSSSWCV